MDEQRKLTSKREREKEKETGNEMKKNGEMKKKKKKKKKTQKWKEAESTDLTWAVNAIPSFLLDFLSFLSSIFCACSF